jgi:hypothetical protein
LGDSPLTPRPAAAAILFRVFREAMGIFTFEMRGLRLEDEKLSFYTKE